MRKTVSERAADTQRACTAVAALSTLRVLFLSTVGGVGASIAPCIAPALTRLTQLAELELSWGDDDPAALTRPLGLLTTLTRLALNIAMGREGMCVVAPGLTCLSQLADLSAPRVTSDGVAALAQPLGSLTTLTRLNLSHKRIQTTDAAELALGLRHLSQLAGLELASTFVDSGGAAALAPALGQLTAVTRLDLGGNKIGADAAASLAPALGRLLRPAELCLIWNRVGAAGAAALAPAIALLTALTSLNLTDTNVGASGAASLAPALGLLSRLADLRPAINKLGAAGARGGPRQARVCLLYTSPSPRD